MIKVKIREKAISASRMPTILNTLICVTWMLQDVNAGSMQAFDRFRDSAGCTQPGRSTVARMVKQRNLFTGNEKFLLLATPHHNHLACLTVC